MSIILFSAKIGPVPLNLVISEKHSSKLGITENPIETGSKITDHAYLEPKQLTLEIADSAAAETYNALVRFQESREPFTFVSGLFVYDNMLIESIEAERDVRTHAVLKGTVTLKEAIIVSTAYTASEGGGGARQSKQGRAGGAKSTNAARPNKTISAPGTTADRATGTVQRGDQASARTVPNESAAKVAARALLGKGK